MSVLRNQFLVTEIDSAVWFNRKFEKEAKKGNVNAVNENHMEKSCQENIKNEIDNGKEWQMEEVENEKRNVHHVYVFCRL